MSARVAKRGMPFALLIACVLTGSAGHAAQRHAVVIEGATFAPGSLTVHVGDRVTWTNNDPYPHTVTAAGKQFDSRTVAAGASWSYDAARKGTFPYICALHPTMKGTLIVE